MEFRGDESFDSWPELFEALLTGEHTNWIYRGHASSSWGLETTLERVIRLAPPERRGDPLGIERGIQRRFMDRAQSFLSDPPSEHDELTWLTLMQHYGAPTRLLDWTNSPLIGLYFAYEEEAPDGAEARALWGLQAFSCRHLFGSKLAFHLRDPFGLIRHQTYKDGEVIEDSHPGADFDWISDENLTFRALRDAEHKTPYPVLPPFRDERMAAQQAFFTYDAALDGGIPADLSVDFPIPVITNGEVTAESFSTPLLRRIVLPHEWRREVLTALRTMGITAATLFPGLDGLGRAARMSAILPDELEDQLGA